MTEEQREQESPAEDMWAYLPLEEVFCQIPQASMTVANTADARMQTAFEQVATFCAQGVDPASIVIVCSSPESAQYLKEKLCALAEATEDAATLGAFVSRIEITWARDIACEILAMPSAQQVVGRRFSGARPRILSSFEEDFLSEDLKTWGTRPGRLRQLCKFLFRGLTELADEAPHWLIMVEEIEIYAFMRKELEYLGAVLEPELSNLATKALRGDNALREQFIYEHVLVYDYECLSRASQLLCHLLAKQSLVAFAGVNSTVDIFESYPFYKGIEEFSRIHPHAKISHIDAPCAAKKEHMGVKDAKQEFGAIAKAVAEQVESGVAAENIGVVCFHPYWAAQVSRALKAQDVAVNSWYKPLVLRGDIRELAYCQPLRAITLLHLLVNKQDSVAWRSWFGYGDYLTRSSEFREIREAAQAEDSQVQFAAWALASPMGAEVAALLDDCRELRGEALIKALVAFVSPEVVQDDTHAIPAVLRSLAALGENTTAEEMITELDKLQFSAGLVPASGVVVTSLAGAASLEFDRVYLAGFVNGMFPVHDFFDLTKITVDKQNKMAEENEEAIALVKTLARDSLVASTFDSIDIELGRRASVKLDRIWQEDDGTQYSDVSASVYLDELLG